MIKLTRKQIKYIVIFQFLLIIGSVINNMHEANKLKQKNSVILAEYIGCKNGHLWNSSYYFKYKVNKKKYVISIPSSSFIYKYDKFSKKGDKYLFLIEKNNPDNYRLTSLKIDYPVGTILDSIYTYEKLDSLNVLLPLIY